MTRAAHPDIRERLLQVALTHFRQQGYTQASVSQITRETGVAKGTFFNHFPTKDHVLSEVLHRWVDEAMERGARGLAGTDAVVAFARSLSASVSADPRVGAELVTRISELPGVGMARAHGGVVRTEERIRGWIEERLAEALPVAVPLVDPGPALLAFVLVCVLRGTLDEWARGRHEPRALEIAMAERMNYVLESSGLPAEA